jgi:hypothetical protein
VTPTATPLPPLAILLAPPGADQEFTNRMQTALNGPITSAGMRLQVRTQLLPDDLNEALILVVALPPDSGISNLAASAPGTQFLTVGISNIEPTANLSAIGADGGRPDRHGFIAGAIAAMLTPEWRVGVISVADTPEGIAARQGFINGGIYFCGLCRPAYPPFYEYPIYVELPAAAQSADWQAAADFLIDRFVQTVYVYPGAGDETTLNYLAQAGVNIISSGSPSETLSPNLVASLSSDPIPLVLEILPDLLNGKGGMDLPMPLEITDVNPDLFSPGRQRLAEEILADLVADYIGTGAIP